MGDDDLIPRMRTCATYIEKVVDEKTSPEVMLHVVRDAMLLLGEGADHIEREHRDRMKQYEAGHIERLRQLQKSVEAQLQTPPCSIEPQPKTLGHAFEAAWVAPGEILTKHSPGRGCPKCGSHAQKKVFREGFTMMLRCPVCDHSWPMAGKNL
jgi:hypothetical protein